MRCTETIYARFGSKRALLGELMQRSVRVADARPVPEQDGPRALAEAADAAELLRLFAADISLGIERAAPLVAVVAAARRSEPGLADLDARLHRNRHNARGCARREEAPLASRRTRRSRRFSR